MQCNCARCGYALDNEFQVCPKCLGTVEVYERERADLRRLRPMPGTTLERMELRATIARLETELAAERNRHDVNKRILEGELEAMRARAEAAEVRLAAAEHAIRELVTERQTNALLTTGAKGGGS